MSDKKKSYRITIRRPIGGIMRPAGAVVALTDREYAAEAGWGGLEPVGDDKATIIEPASVAEPVADEPAISGAQLSASEELAETIDLPVDPVAPRKKGK
jgi:hypothetical protein